MLFDIIHQEADRKDRDDKRHDAAHQQRADLTERKDAALGKELDQLEAGSARHDRDGQKEGELGRTGAAHAAEQAADDGRAAAGGAGDQRQHLPCAHDDCLLVGNAAQLGGGRYAGAALDQNERNAVDDQHDRNDHAVVEVCVHPVIQQQAQHGGGQAGHKDLAPQPHDRPADVLGQTGIAAVIAAEGPKLFEVKHHDRKDCTQLDDNAEHLHKLGAQAEFQHLLSQNHVAGAGDGQPFGNALDHAVDDRAQHVKKQFHSTDPPYNATLYHTIFRQNRNSFLRIYIFFTVNRAGVLPFSSNATIIRVISCAKRF